MAEKCQRSAGDESAAVPLADGGAGHPAAKICKGSKTKKGALRRASFLRYFWKQEESGSLEKYEFFSKKDFLKPSGSATI